MAKLQRLDAANRKSERHFAELIAQKQRLQQLESEYARKIQKLKEAQALRNKGSLPDLQGEPAARASPPPDQNLPPVPAQLATPPVPPSSSSSSSPSSFPVPQPSLHDLTQDKLTLDSEDAPEADDQEAEVAPPLDPASPAAASVGTRRHSFRQSNSNFTKPHLEQLTSTPVGDCGGSSAKAAKASVPSTAAASTKCTTDSLAGLDFKALVQRHQQQAQLGDLFLREMHKMEPPVDQQPTGQVRVNKDLNVIEILGY